MPRVTITVPDSNAQPYRFQLDRQVVTLGRGSENDIVIDSASVSASHAEMRRVIGGYELHDLGSTNGIKLDGERRPVIALKHGATLKIGDVAFDFFLSDEEQGALNREKPFESSPILKEAELPAAPRGGPPRPREIVIRQESSGGMGFFAALLVLLLALAAFLAGIQIRHQKETGRSLVEGVKAKYSGKTAPAAPAAPAEE